MKELNDHELLEQISKQLEEQRKLIDSLAARLSELERKMWNPYKEPFKVYNVCPTCGLRLDNVMSYCCSHIDCPTGLGPVRC
jgi:DNA repair exonuclease SbcCD ATPase subunit